MKTSTSRNFDSSSARLPYMNTGIDNVEPNLALTPVELIRRFATGNLTGIHVNDFYFDVPMDSPIIPDCDLSFNDVRAMRNFIDHTTFEARKASELRNKAQREERAKSEKDSMTTNDE